MTDSATVVWVDSSPTAEDKDTLDSWARARGVSLVMPIDREMSTIAVDPAIATTVERDLEATRDAIAKLDVRGAETALSHADRTLRDHPELPQAAWLLAEVERGWSARWTRLEPKSDERAAEAWSRARALDGGRAAGVGERSFDAREQPVSYMLTAEVPAGASVVWDGKQATLGTSNGADGLHQLRVELAGRTLFASWVSIAEGTLVRLSVHGPAACSRGDLTSVRSVNGVITAPAVACERWVAIVSRGAGKIGVATCSRDACGEAIDWATPSSPVVTPGLRPHFAWPAWATWTVVSVAVLAGVGVALGAAGVFSPRPTTTRFVQGGVKTESVPLP